MCVVCVVCVVCDVCVCVFFCLSVHNDSYVAVMEDVSGQSFLSTFQPKAAESSEI